MALFGQFGAGPYANGGVILRLHCRLADVHFDSLLGWIHFDYSLGWRFTARAAVIEVLIYAEIALGGGGTFTYDHTRPPSLGLAI